MPRWQLRSILAMAGKGLLGAFGQVVREARLGKGLTQEELAFNSGLNRNFVIEIEKGRLGDKTQRAEGKTMLVDWTENGFVSVEPKHRTAITVRRTAPPSRPVIAPLGDRLSQTG